VMQKKKINFIMVNMEYGDITSTVILSSKGK